MRFPTTQQFARLHTLGVTPNERDRLIEGGYDYHHVADLITEAARWPLGTGALRHFRIFRLDPRTELATADRDALTAWRYTRTLPANLNTVFGANAWRLLPGLLDLPDALTDIARAGRVDAAGNGAIEQRIGECTILYAGLVTAARRDGRMTGADHDRYAAAFPERLRRAGREWRALARRQRATRQLREAYRARVGVS